MATMSKQCQDCGQRFDTRRDNAKFCSVCRTLKNLDFINDFTVPCWQCGERMSPIERGDKTCGNCGYAPKKHGIDVCGFCNEEHPIIAKDVAVCHRCAKIPSLRKDLLKAMRKKVNLRRQEAVPA